MFKDLKEVESKEVKQLKRYKLNRHQNFLNMSASDISTKQVKNKVLYSELDVPFNKYLETLSKVTRLTNKVLNSQIDECDEDYLELLSLDGINEIYDTAQLRFMSLQNSIESKKILYENWQQSNQMLLDTIDEKAHITLPKLKKCHEQLRIKLDRLKRMSDSINMINKEIESLSDGNTSISITKTQWESQLGVALTERLISENYLRRDKYHNSRDPQEIKYRALDDFSVGPQESQRINNTLKEDLKKLQKELSHYKNQWLKDAEVFTRITGFFQEELKKRQLSNGNIENSGDIDMDEDIVEEDEYLDNRQRSTIVKEEIERASSNDSVEEDIEIEDESPEVETPLESEVALEDVINETTPDI